MPLGPLSFASLAARIASPFIRLGRRIGQPIQRLTERLRRRISGLRGEEVAAQATALERIEQASARIAAARRDRVPDSIDIAPALTRQRRTFSWRFRVRVVDPELGEVVQQFVTVSTDRNLSLSEAESEARQIATVSPRIAGEDVVETEFVSVTRAAPEQLI